jgi:hypothetical protein
MPQVGFEPTILVFEREKTVHALDRAATVISGVILLLLLQIEFHPTNQCAGLWRITITFAKHEAKG